MKYNNLVKVGSDNTLSSKLQMMIITTFNEIHTREISRKGELIAVVSKFGNKLHIYSLNDFQLKYCMFLTNSEHKIFNLSFDKKSKLVSMLSFDGEDMILSIQDLKNSAAENQFCECDDHDDKGVKLISSQKKEASTFFGSLVSKITNVSGVIYICYGLWFIF